MTIEQARKLAAALTAAANNAEQRGVTRVAIVDELRALDDAARDELLDAIARAS